MSLNLRALTSWWKSFLSSPDNPQGNSQPRPTLEPLEERITLTTSVLVKDIDVGLASADPEFFTNVNGRLFFAADSGPTGTELWSTDGTSAGTQLVADLQPGGFGSYPDNFANVNGTLFFAARDSFGGDELWKSDGTSLGTELVRNINTMGSSFPNELTNVNGVLFFAARSSGNGEELWRSDGTSLGTQLVKDIRGGTASSFPTELTNVNGTLLFRASNPAAGTELWRSNGTNAGTTLVKNIRAGTTSSFPRYLTNVGGTLFFSASEGNTGIELWRSDGTQAGTTLVSDIDPGVFSSFPTELTEFNGTLFFSADPGFPEGRELWKSDGTSVGTQLVKDIDIGFFGSNPGNLTNINGTLYFVADDGVTSRELWKSDGTSLGTELVSDIATGSLNSNPEYLTNLNGRVFFAATDTDGDREIWSSDGTSAGTRLVSDVRPGPVSSDPRFLTEFSDELFFVANDGNTGRELWTIQVPVGTPDLVAASDTGTSNTDNRTSDTTPTFVGTADPDAVVEIFDGNTSLGLATNNNGNWTFTATTPLSLGQHRITARASDLGLTSVSDPLDIDIVLEAFSPSVTITQAPGQSDPALGATAIFIVTFSEPVTGLDVGDFKISGSADVNTLIVTPTSGFATEFTVIAVRSLRGGDVRLTLPAGAALDASGNPSLVATELDNVVEFRIVRPRTAIGADAGGAPLVQLFDETGAQIPGILAYDPAFTGGVRVATGDINGDFVEDIITAPGVGGGPLIRVFDGQTGELIREFFAYDGGFTGGVFVAAGDINGDGLVDIITGAGAGGGPHVKVFDGETGAEIRSFFAYDAGFGGGVSVAVADVNRDGFADIVTGAGAGGGPHVKVFDGETGEEIRSFFAYDAAFAGGVFVGAGDLNLDGFAEIVTGAGAGGGPHVRVFNGSDNRVIHEYFAYDAAFTGGVRVSVGDNNGDNLPDIITGAGPGGGPAVSVSTFPAGNQQQSFDPYAGFAGGFFVASGDITGDGIADIVTGADAGGTPLVKIFDGETGAELRGFFAYDPSFAGGVRVAVGDVNGDGFADILTAAGTGGSAHIKVFDGLTGEVFSSFFAFDPAFLGGAYVASADVNGDQLSDIIVGAGPGGGPHVRVFSGLDGSELRSFFAYASDFTGGVRVAGGDVNGDGFADIISGAGPGGAPLVKVFNGQTGAEDQSFLAYDGAFAGGVFVGAGDINGDGFADILTGPGAGGGPHVQAFDGQTSLRIRSFFAFTSDFTGGVRVAGGDLTGDGLANIINGTGPGGTILRVADFTFFAELSRFLALDGTFNGGIYVG